jgi:hypothetical protein
MTSDLFDELGDARVGLSLITVLEEDISASSPVPAMRTVREVAPDRRYQTPMPGRSSPPTDTQRPHHCYVTLRELPPSVTYGQVAPWFGQPGGGILVSLDRVVRWYYDAGFLDEVVVPSPSSNGTDVL